MFVAPGYNPLAPIGEGFAKGFAPAVEQGMNRQLLQSGLDKAQQLMSQEGVTPGSIYVQLAKSLAGVPGGPQLLAETYPILMQEYRRANFANRGQGGFGQQQPGQSNFMNQLSQASQNAPAGSPLARLYEGFQPQDTGMQPQDIESRRPVDRGEPIQQQKGRWEPQTARSIPRAREAQQEPQAYRKTPEEALRDVQDLVAAGLPVEQAVQAAAQLQGIEATPQKMSIEQSQEQREREKWATAREAAADTFLEDQYKKYGIDDEYFQRKGAEEYNRLKADESAGAKNLTDRQRWEKVHRDIQRSQNALSSLSKMSGRPFTGLVDKEGFNEVRRGMEHAAKAFYDASGGYNDTTKQYDIRAVDKMIKSIGPEWLDEEKHQIATPMSDAVREVLEDAPPPYVENWNGKWSHDQIAKTGKEYKIDQIAAKLAKVTGPWDPIIAFRAKLSDLGYDTQDIREIFDKMQSEYGWKPNPEYQDRQLVEINSSNANPTLRDAIRGGKWKRFLLRPGV